MTGQQSPITIGRRRFLGGSAAVGGVALGFGALDGLAVRAAQAQQGRRPIAHHAPSGYGDLIPLTRTDPVTGFAQTLELPAGFDFRVLGLAGTQMDDGNVTPLGHDGMAAFAGPHGAVRLVRNHEERSGAGSAHPSGGDPATRYDAKGGGGTSTLQVRVSGDGDRVLESAWMSLAGTIVNCAGGPTPSGSWLSCEETTAGPGAGWECPHGYVFEVPSASDGIVDPVALPAMGRFVHEAVAVDPRTGIVYETEDRDTSGFYRFIPHDPGALAAGGRLQMLTIKGMPQYDTRTGQQAARRMPVEWVDIDDPDPADAESNPLAVYQRGHHRGGATFARLEGCWWGNGAGYLVSTNGGDAGQGQVWEYRPAGNSGGTLTLVYESPDRNILSFPDNITVTPRGALLLCEDTSRSRPALVGLTRDGRVFQFCVDPTNDEWCGATFSPDGQTLFANLQGATSGDPRTTNEPGRTVAIWGPWSQGPL